MIYQEEKPAYYCQHLALSSFSLHQVLQATVTAYCYQDIASQVVAAVLMLQVTPVK